MSAPARLVIITAESRLRELHDRLMDGSITVEEMHEAVDLMAPCEITVSGEQLEHIRKLTGH